MLQVEKISQADVDEYEINDGQMKIRTIYNSAEKISEAILAYEKIAQKLLNKLNGRVMALRSPRGLS